MEKRKKKKRILLVRTDRIGDVILSTPAIKATRRRFPDAFIAFMTRPYAEGVVRNNPYLDEVIIYDKYGRHMSWIRTFFFGLRLRKKRFDMAIILHPTNRTHILSYLAAIPERIGLDRKLPFLLTKKLPDEKYRGQKHELEYTLNILDAIGIGSAGKELLIGIDESSESHINSILKKNGVKSADKIVAVHPGASCRSKQWPAGRFAAVADELRRRYEIKIALVAGQDDARAAKEFLDCADSGIIDLSGRTDVIQLAAFLRRSCLFISNDSGPVHIAAAVGTPNVVIFGRNQPGLNARRWGPTGKDDVFLHGDAGCRSCEAHNCKKGYACLRAVSADEVIRSAGFIMDARCRIREESSTGG